MDDFFENLIQEMTGNMIENTVLINNQRNGNYTNHSDSLLDQDDIELKLIEENIKQIRKDGESEETNQIKLNYIKDLNSTNGDINNNLTNSEKKINIEEKKM